MTFPHLPSAPDVLEVAKRVVWFEPPQIAIADTARFLAYLMTYGTADDVAIIRKYIEESSFAEALDAAPPGIFDERSWAYWNLLAGRYPPPALPDRQLP
jgi:hypothetical protein